MGEHDRDRRWDLGQRQREAGAVHAGIHSGRHRDRRRYRAASRVHPALERPRAGRSRRARQPRARSRVVFVGGQRRAVALEDAGGRGDLWRPIGRHRIPGGRRCSCTAWRGRPSARRRLDGGIQVGWMARAAGAPAYHGSRRRLHCVCEWKPRPHRAAARCSRRRHGIRRGWVGSPSTGRRRLECGAADSVVGKAPARSAGRRSGARPPG